MSAPVDVIVPFEVAVVVAIEGNDASTKAGDEAVVGSDAEVDRSVAVTEIEELLAMLLLLLLLLRVDRLLARAEIRLLRSSRSKDLSGDTCWKSEEGTIRNIAI